MPLANRLILEHVYAHEAQRGDQLFMTQPLGGGAVATYTWGQALDQARRMAAHLRAQGFEPGARVAILSKNCAHFIMAELAVWMAGLTTVAIFPTESAQTVRYVLEHSEARLLFVGKLDTWPQQEPGVSPDLPRIAFPLAPATPFDTWDAIVGRTAPLLGQAQRAPDDLALLMYTSGSTGQPKGAMHNFAGISTVAERIAQTIEDRNVERTPWRALSYLPLAHVYERAWIECAFLVNGHGQLFFAESLDTFLQDLQRARPTLFVSVPRLWLKFQQGVFSKMPPKKLDRLLSIPILGRIVARKVLTGLGLQDVKLAASGSAPIPAELIVWYRKLGLNLFEGYAMTEDFAFSHGSTLDISAPGYVGVPYDGVDVRIAEDGEVLVRSPGRLVGYFKRPDLDAEAVTEDGFFRTGDLGLREANGLLKLTGRKKELFKTGKGKYIAPAPIENQINVHPALELSMVSGVGQVAAYALVQLAEHLRPRRNDPALRAEVSAQLQELLQQVNAEWPDYSQLKMLVVADEPWSIENGCLTPTMKIKRAAIERSVEGRLDGWYAGRDRVVWA